MEKENRIREQEIVAKVSPLDLQFAMEMAGGNHISGNNLIGQNGGKLLGQFQRVHNVHLETKNHHKKTIKLVDFWENFFSSTSKTLVLHHSHLYSSRYSHCDIVEPIK